MAANKVIGKAGGRERNSENLHDSKNAFPKVDMLADNVDVFHGVCSNLECV